MLLEAFRVHDCFFSPFFVSGFNNFSCVKAYRGSCHISIYMTVQSRSRSASRLVASVAAIAPIAILLAAPGAPEISFPLLPFLKFELWEIPVYFAFYFFGFRTAVLTELVVYAVVQTHPSTILFAPVYNLVAVLLTLVGLRIGLLAPRFSKPIGLGVASVIRALGMMAFNYVFIQLPVPFGFSYPLKLVLPILPPIGIFNVIVTLYSAGSALAVYEVVWRRLVLPARNRVPAGQRQG